MNLYRPEAITHQRRRLQGEVTIHQPISFAVLTAFLFVISAVLGAYVTLGSVARKETVAGWITPRAGMAQVYPPKVGIASAVFVRLGQQVTAGQALARLNLDLNGAEGGLAARERVQTLARLAELDVQLAQSAVTHKGEGVRIRQRAAALEDEANNIRGQRTFALEQLGIAKADLARVEPEVKRGFVSLGDYDRRRQAVLAQQQVVADMDRRIASLEASAADARSEAMSSAGGGTLEASQLRAARAALVQTLAEIDVQGSNVIRAPISGTIAYMNLRPGETVASNTPVFAVSPTADELEAELIIPTRAAGFIEPGQQVRLMIDAFPFQRYGIVHGVVDQISRAAVSPNQIAAPFEIKETSYRATARISLTGSWARAARHEIRPGMTVKADIVTDRRTFLQWVLDPLIAAARRGVG